MNIHNINELLAGGPGSGCRGPNCGRPPGPGHPEDHSGGNQLSKAHKEKITEVFRGLKEATYENADQEEDGEIADMLREDGDSYGELADLASKEGTTYSQIKEFINGLDTDPAERAIMTLEDDVPGFYKR